MIQFYSKDIETTFSLGPEESSHCVRVLRKRVGDTIYITDGKGWRFTCRLTEADPKNARVEINRKEYIGKSRDYSITIAIAPTKNSDRMSWLIEKTVEIGIDRIIFINTQYTERTHINIERLRRNAISAMNQSLKTFLPEVIDGGKMTSILEIKGEKFFGYCDNETPRAVFVKEISAGKDIVVAIGPEGDFSRDEVKNLMEASFKPVTFGNERLRTETAAIYAVTAIHVLNDYLDKK